ncbi:MAG: flagellar basal body rod protein FlgB [Rhodospirillaceae bacterium]|nr:flagellar basal body rod protein FlgB [Rhodospirillaceae bacterium]
MDLDKLTLFGMMKGKMRWLNQRQEVLAQNIANADTPNYRPRDIKAFDFKDMVQAPQNRLNMNATTAGHLPGRVQRNGVADEVIGRSYETSPDGNAVVLEEQMGKIGETQLGHRLITELYRKQISMFKTAIGKNR